MASTLPIQLPSLLFHGRKTLSRNFRKLPFSAVGDKKRNSAVAVKATEQSSESSTSLSIVKSVQTVWDKSEDRLGVVGLGFAAVVAIWASSNLISAIDKLPVIPGVLEFVGILFSWWFIYRYLLFKPDREELLQIISKSTSDILGQ
ncbi:protein CURVATURE THYLAKOID 1C, chloroplastic [Macadamia integrifolia]|uniref:protein CURVATURE THYLAKOID 1C, chloroplastic n=1 Tax=Macadamia integrifolia TaxID=60698 RepID=UPI001C4F2293|nr:protein CURVATURE THYLAKOID 1C, chloroplastic [Macadamia integrifolia]XP_042487564.1 protein CURVATURE THYLAKOID 1C, chloroplastic [Macadamia integrifolia]